ncbi:SDR family oxidoreductase [Erythrobacter alti]|uniref:SDR family NAD(P)-dependent oxidoreductase n=1 Tax=Erythrobacter alti TaxID=1896145 RepID=UPI0030F375C5
MSDKGRKALVIGASSRGGLGEAVARRLAASGCHVTVAARSEEAISQLARELDGRHAVCNIRDEASLATLFESSGPVEIVVNAAGTTCAGGIARIERAQLEDQMELHFTANALLLKHAAPAMSGGGSVVLFSSVTAALAGAGLASYSCAKAACEQLVRIAAVELGERGIRVNAVAPGFSQTPMTQSIFADPALTKLYLGHVPLGCRAVTPEEVASAVLWLTSRDCFTTGETIQVSGGAQLGRLPNKNDFKELRKA